MHNLVCEGRNALSTDIAAMSPKCAIFDEREFPISKVSTIRSLAKLDAVCWQTWQGFLRDFGSFYHFWVVFEASSTTTLLVLQHVFEITSIFSHILSHTFTHMHSRTRAHSHTLSLSFSLSLSKHPLSLSVGTTPLSHNTSVEQPLSLEKTSLSK